VKGKLELYLILMKNMMSGETNSLLRFKQQLSFIQSNVEDIEKVKKDAQSKIAERKIPKR
jgi:hypothetical protein